MQVDHNTIVRVHPAALASIVDGHERREKRGTSRSNFILGTLMGSADSKLITVDQAFTIGHILKQDNPNDENSELEFQYDYEHHFDMESLIRASNKDCQVIGWFSTANKSMFGEVDKMVSELYFSPENYYTKGSHIKSYGLPSKPARNPKPIFLRVNAELLRDKKHKNIDSLPIKAFLPEAFNIEETNSILNDLIWTEMSCEIGCGAAERTALDLMMKTTLPVASSAPKEGAGPSLQVDAVGSNLDPLNNLTHTILQKIDMVQTYIQAQLEKPDHELDANMGRMLSDIFTGVPGLDKDTMEGLLNGELTDLLMVTFLSHLAKVQITLNDKLKQQHGQKTIQKRAYQKNTQDSGSK